MSENAIRSKIAKAAGEGWTVEIETRGGTIYNGHVTTSGSASPTVELGEKREAGGAYIDVDAVIVIDAIAAIRLVRR